MDGIIVETSARHCHLSPEDLVTLFGEGYELTPKKWLTQPGQFSAEERVKLIGPKSTIEKFGIIGPVRGATQIELSYSDARALGIIAPLRMSGDVAGSAGCKLVGPKGEIELSEGVIIAKRHIHFDPASAEKYNVTDGEVVQAKIDTDGRSLIFDDVVCRCGASHALAMHIDTDEANAAGVKPDTTCQVIKKA